MSEIISEQRSLSLWSWVAVWVKKPESEWELEADESKWESDFASEWESESAEWQSDCIQVNGRVSETISLCLTLGQVRS